MTGNLWNYMGENVTFQTVAIVASAVGGTAWLTWFIRNQFSFGRRLVFRLLSQHNREDDDLFAHLAGLIYEIHLRNALKDGERPPEHSPLPRRRYLLDDGGDIAPAE